MTTNDPTVSIQPTAPTDTTREQVEADAAYIIDRITTLFPSLVAAARDGTLSSFIVFADDGAMGVGRSWTVGIANSQTEPRILRTYAPDADGNPTMLLQANPNRKAEGLFVYQDTPDTITGLPHFGFQGHFGTAYVDWHAQDAAERSGVSPHDLDFLLQALANHCTKSAGGKPFR